MRLKTFFQYSNIPVEKTSWLLCAVLFALWSHAEAQQPTKLPRIGYLTVTSRASIAGRLEAFRQGLRELGYLEGKSIFIELRSGEEKSERLPALAAELVRLKVDVIVTGGAGATRSAKEATKTVPIVMSQDPDPVGNGFVASLARPGGNITGLSSLSSDLFGKRLELLKEILPKFSRVAVFGTSTNPGNAQSLKETELATEALRLKLQYLDVLNSKNIETAFRAASKGRADAVLALNSPVVGSRGKQVAEFAVTSGSRWHTPGENLWKLEGL